MKTIKLLLSLLVIFAFLSACQEETDPDKLPEAGGGITDPNKMMEGTDGYFVRVDDMPEPIGGIEAIQQNIHYPELMNKAGIEGRVYVTAYINESGDVDKVTLLKGIHPALDEEAMRGVKMSKFKPGYQNGKAMKTRVAVPVMFKSSYTAADAPEKKEFEGKTVPDRLVKGEPGTEYLVAPDKPAEPVGGLKSIMERVKYPEVAKQAGVEGKVFVKVFIDENGNTVGVDLVKGVNEALNNAAMIAVEETKWEPAVHKGKKVKSQVIIPTMFKLSPK